MLPGFPRQDSFLSRSPTRYKSPILETTFRWITSPRPYTVDELLSSRREPPVKKKMVRRLCKLTGNFPKEVRSAEQGEGSGARNVSGQQRMGEFGIDGTIPKTIGTFLDRFKKRSSLGNIAEGDGQPEASSVAAAVPASHADSEGGGQRERAVSLARSLRTPGTEGRATEQQENTNPAALNPETILADADPTRPTRPQEDGEIQGPATSLPWRTNAGPPQGEPILSWSDVAGSYQPGQVVWVPSHNDMSQESILHGHEDFGIDPADPSGLTYHQAYAHPALVWKEDTADDSKYICLKITSWSDWSAVPGGKWDPNSSAARDRRRFYVPLFITDESSRQDLPVLFFKDGKSMPQREEAVENRSHVNVERVFLVEKDELRDFRLGCQRHELFLTEDSMIRLETYRNGIGRNDLVDMLTLVRQRCEHREWLRRLNQSASQPFTCQPNSVIWPKKPT